MTIESPTEVTDSVFPETAFDIETLEDEMRADQLIGDLLQLFCQAQVSTHGQPPEVAGLMARGADYFLRDFIIADRQDNIFHIHPERVRQFAGNWYIVKNLEPNMAELGDILDGVATFYTWLLEQGRVNSELTEAVNLNCQNLVEYEARIESFWNLVDDGFIAWDKACPIDHNHG